LYATKAILTLHAVAGIAASSYYLRDYAVLRRDMAYGANVEFEEAMRTVSALGDRLDERS
jgi:hypothetical protein